MRRLCVLVFVVLLAVGSVPPGSVGGSAVAATPHRAESRSIAVSQSVADGCTETVVSIDALDQEGRAFPFTPPVGVSLKVSIDRMDTCIGKTLWQGTGSATMPASTAAITIERATLAATIDIVRTDTRGAVVPFALDLAWSGAGRVTTATSVVTYYPGIRCVTENAQRPAAVTGTVRGTVDGEVWAFGPEGWHAASMERQRQSCDSAS